MDRFIEDILKDAWLCTNCCDLTYSIGPYKRCERSKIILDKNATLESINEELLKDNRYLQIQRYHL